MIHLNLVMMIGMMMIGMMMIGMMMIGMICQVMIHLILMMITMMMMIGIEHLEEICQVTILQNLDKHQHVVNFSMMRGWCSSFLGFIEKNSEILQNLIFLIYSGPSLIYPSITITTSGIRLSRYLHWYRGGGTISTLGRSVLHEFFKSANFCIFHRVKSENIMTYLTYLSGWGLLPLSRY